MIQQILAFTILGIAVVFLVWKFFLKKNKSDKNCGNDDNCGCN